MSASPKTIGPVRFESNRSVGWCVVSGKDAAHPVLRCRHCGGAYALHLPATEAVARAVLRAFVEDHCGCLDAERAKLE